MDFVYITLTMADIHKFFVICEYGLILISLFVIVTSNVIALYAAFFVFAFHILFCFTKICVRMI